MIISIRAHHLLCIHGFEGRGYSKAFIANFARQRSILNDETMIEVKATADVFCSKCHHLQSGCCRSDEKVRDIDQRVLEILRLKVGERLTWREVKFRTAIAVSATDLEWICSGCEWLGKGSCRRGIDRLVADNLVNQVIPSN